MNRKAKGKTRVVALGMAILTSLSVSSMPAMAHTEQNNTVALADISEHGVRSEKYLLTVRNKNLGSYSRIKVSVGGINLSVDGFVANGITYIPFRAASNTISGSKYSYNSSSKSSTLTASGLEFTATDGCYVSYANGRALFSMSPNVIMSDGRLYIPADVFAKAIGMTVSTGNGSTQITGRFNPILHASKFYREDEVLWLARIIHAESKGEPLLGQIAVGNVVLNRVGSAYYPNTIYGVIFDRKYGVQFSPILDGSIYNTPSYNSTLAAKICLEGYDVSEGAFFFLNLDLATSSWIPRTREYAFTIGNHDFYK